MKRLFVHLLIGLMLILSACGATNPTKDADKSSNVDQSSTTTTTGITDEPHFRANILEIKGSYFLVEPLKGDEILRSADRISFGYDAGDAFRVGDKVVVYYTGEVMESYPAQVWATRMVLLDKKA